MQRRLVCFCVLFLCAPKCKSFSGDATNVAPKVLESFLLIRCYHQWSWVNWASGPQTWCACSLPSQKKQTTPSLSVTIHAHAQARVNKLMDSSSYAPVHCFHRRNKQHVVERPQSIVSLHIFFILFHVSCFLSWFIATHASSTSNHFLYSVHFQSVKQTSKSGENKEREREIMSQDIVCQR